MKSISNCNDFFYILKELPIHIYWKYQQHIIKIKIKKSKNQNSLLNLLINFRPTRWAPKILSLKYEFNPIVKFITPLEISIKEDKAEMEIHIVTVKPK